MKHMKPSLAQPHRTQPCHAYMRCVCYLYYWYWDFLQPSYKLTNRHQTDAISTYYILHTTYHIPSLAQAQAQAKAQAPSDPETKPHPVETSQSVANFSRLFLQYQSQST